MRGEIMEGTKYTTKEAVLKRGQEAISIPLKDIDKTGRISIGKGAVGSIIEESWFGYSINSESEPDFPEAGVELKVTPYVRGKKGEIRAKERLVCNIINYMEEYDKTFKTSSFWHKCETMLLMSYEHLKDVPKGEFKIDKAILFSFPEDDLLIIENDWKTIMEKVRNGNAHLISEGDTMYLAACTKGANASSVRKQPFSDIMAKQRAYSLKASYMTQILNRYIFGKEENEHVIKDWHQLRTSTFEDIIISSLRPFFGNSQEELKKIFSIENSPKNLNEVLLAKMLGIHGKIAYTEEFQKAGIVPKTIRVQRNGKIKESMSFPTFDFIALSKEKSWEDSKLYNYLAPTKFLFVIFKENDSDEYVFERVKFWNIPNDDLDEVRKVWERTVNTIREGVQLIPTEHGVSNNLPKSTENSVAHVRPHGKDSNDKLPLPDGRMMTKQCFWLNRTYVEKQIND
jgi:DNA mismatch repair endonuclease MutH